MTICFNGQFDHVIYHRTEGAEVNEGNGDLTPVDQKYSLQCDLDYFRADSEASRDSTQTHGLGGLCDEYRSSVIGTPSTIRNSLPHFSHWVRNKKDSSAREAMEVPISWPQYGHFIGFRQRCNSVYRISPLYGRGSLLSLAVLKFIIVAASD